MSALPNTPIEVLPPLIELTVSDESNHRIANNLQLLSSLVAIEARQTGDPEAREVLTRTLHRIGAIAAVHRHLYRSRRPGRINVASYLQELGGQLEQSYAHPHVQRRVMVLADADAEVPVEAATSIGVIVSEVVGNAWKYAYRPEEPGSVHVSFTCTKGRGHWLEIVDRGAGISDEVAPHGSGFGLRLIGAIAARLGGTPRWTNALPGTRFSLRMAL